MQEIIYPTTLRIPKQVSDDIWSVLHNAGNNEWCGFIFFSIEDDGFTLHDFTVEDYGSHSFTDFTLTPKQNVLIAQMQLKGYFWGMLHSHHTMNCFFSQTDIHQLREGSEQMMYFVSLIVGLKNDWVARMGWVEKQEGLTFGKGKYERRLELEKPILHAFYINLDLEREQNTDNPKVQRLQELRKSKKATTKPPAATKQPYTQPELFQSDWDSLTIDVLTYNGHISTWLTGIETNEEDLQSCLQHITNEEFEKALDDLPNLINTLLVEEGQVYLDHFYQEIDALSIKNKRASQILQKFENYA